MELQLLMRRPIWAAMALAVLFVSCTKEITVDLPTTEAKLVVEGTIETGQPPIVILTKTQSYFAPTSIESIASIFIKDAVITVSDGFLSVTLDQICSSDLTEEQIQLAAAATGLDPGLLASADICIYSKLDNSMVGVEGRSYSLSVLALDKTASSVTSIPYAVPLNALWFRLAQQRPNDDSLGFIFANLSDPDTTGNAYRWFAQRINAGLDGEQKDDRFIAPLFSVFEDRFVNALTFDFNFNRGSSPFSTATDDQNEESGFFKRGDTVVVKFVSIGIREFEFYDSFANNVASQGDLFSTPANVRSNISGGLGVWAGYAPALDTLVCVP